MKNLGCQLMTLLWRKVCAKKREDWFEVFLTGFILINNIEYVYGIQKAFVRMYAITTVSIIFIGPIGASILIGTL